MGQQSHIIILETEFSENRVTSKMTQRGMNDSVELTTRAYTCVDIEGVASLRRIPRD